ncbi:hypothetical protein DL769_000700 [Monosporascus sp. CRB-8-3]|nr:hypothetical protein DL769_000700 [Monosporascus sp. CRB-8-3]
MVRQEYDFVIISGGTAGLVVATGLTENVDVSALVPEAVENALQDPRIDIPAMWSAVFGTDLDWDFMAMPQEELNGRQIGEPQGYVLGGSGAINAEVFIRPSAVGFDAWEPLGNPGWSWHDVAPYFRRFHTLNMPNEVVAKHLDLSWIDEAIKGTSGPIQTNFIGVVEDPLGKAWNETFRKLGLVFEGGPFNGRGLGGWWIPASIDPVSKTRSYAAAAYFAPAKSREILRSSPALTGVIFKLKDGTTHQVNANREVLLAAGVFKSPKMLELSGVGGKALLDRLGIETKVNNPGVCEYLQDHLMTRSSAPNEACGSLFMIPAQVNLHNGPKQSGMTRDCKPGDFISIGAFLQYPLSRSTSHISSLDPSAPPTIDSCYLSLPLDIEIYARHPMASRWALIERPAAIT